MVQQSDRYGGWEQAEAQSMLSIEYSIIPGLTQISERQPSLHVPADVLSCFGQPTILR